MNALDAADWPHLDTHEIVILRRLEIDAEARDVGHAAAAQLRRLLNSAVVPWAVGAQQAQAVKFADHADFITGMCQEILRPSLPRAWFWQKHLLSQQILQQPSSAALLSALSEELLLLPAVANRLLGHGLLGEVIQALGNEHLNQLLAQLRHVTGFALDPQTLQTSLYRSTGELVGDDTLPRDAELQRWKSSLTAIPRSLAHSGATLLAVLITWEKQPYRLLAARSAIPLVSNVARQLLSPETESGREEHGAQEVPSPRSQEIGHTPNDMEATETVPPSGDKNDWGDQQASIEAPVPSVKRGTKEQPADGPAATTGQHWFITQCGGFYYLLNLLRQPALLEILKQSGDSPWQHLYLMSRLLDIELDLPLLEFIAAQLRMDDIQALDALRPHGPDRRLVDLAAQRMAHHPFWPHDLIRKTARVRHDHVYLDIDFHSRSVDLEIRLAGLDVNPGWLPWLGRVVNFHYIDDPILQGGEA